MRWENLPESGNVEDRRGRGGMGGGGGGLMLGGAGGLLLFAVVMIAGFYGIDLTPILGGGGGIIPGGGGLGGGITQSAPYQPTAEEQDMARFTSVALKTTEDTWGGIFQQMGRAYAPPKLVMYSGVTQTGCGYGQAAMGPFYCPDDETVYIDLSFYKDMQAKMGGGGDFAQGYVLSHEVGHHIQHLLGIDQQVMRLRQRASPAESNRLSVMMELQADCYAGIWGRAMERQGILEEGDLEQALRTAEAIGDDRLQRQSMGRVVPDSFTHGSSQQRYYWFKRGFDSGNPGQCNTFASAVGRD